MKRAGIAISILFALLIPNLPSRGAASEPPDREKAPAAGSESRGGDKTPGAAARGRSEKTTLAPGAELNGKKKGQGISAGMPVYRPPLRGTPGGRVGGGTRGTGEEFPSICVLAPDHTGLTIQEQPSLYWHLSGQTRYPVELTVAKDNAVTPLLETRVKAPLHPGVNRIRLDDYGIRLSPGVTYKWFVSIVSDPDRRSKDTVAGGMIRRIEPPDTLDARTTGSDKAAAVAGYAEAGLWYDAVQSISELIDASPDEAAFRRQRASLMEQAGLPEVAESDMKGLDAGKR